MKRFFSFASIVSLACAVACQPEAEPQTVAPSTRTMTVHAGAAGTRTAVQISGNDYNVTWKAGDQIQVAEVFYANYSNTEGPSPYQIVQSEQLAADAANASFTVTPNSRVIALLFNNNTKFVNSYNIANYDQYQ